MAAREKVQKAKEAYGEMAVALTPAISIMIPKVYHGLLLVSASKYFEETIKEAHGNSSASPWYHIYDMERYIVDLELSILRDLIIGHYLGASSANDKKTIS